MQFRLLAATFGAALALALALPAAAQTDPPAEVLAKWGMLGTWAVNCNTPPSRGNGYSTYEAEGSTEAVLRRDFGAELERDRSQIQAARIAEDGMLHLTINLTSIGQVRTNVFMKVGAVGMRAFENRGPDGSYTVRDGKFLHNGLPTATQYRCR